jgi:hypothetical protein
MARVAKGVADVILIAVGRMRVVRGTVHSHSWNIGPLQQISASAPQSILRARTTRVTIR